MGSLDGRAFTGFLAGVRSYTNGQSEGIYICVDVPLPVHIYHLFFSVSLGMATADMKHAANFSESSHFSPHMAPKGGRVPLLNISGASSGSPGSNLLETTLACVTYQILWGLAYLHYDHNIHRDIKPGTEG